MTYTTHLEAGKAAMAAGQYPAALAHLHRAEGDAPADLDLLLALAESNHRIDDWHETERYYRRVLEIEPANVSALASLELTVREQGRYAEARGFLNQLLERLPEQHDAIVASRAMLDLADGKFAEGFADYEKRLTGFKRLARLSPILPRWTGEDLHGKSIVIREEQGLGDTVQFARYAAFLRGLGARVGLCCRPTLQRLLARVPGVDSVVSDVAGFDFEVMVMSLPGLAKTFHETDIPASPYLSVEQETVPGRRPKVGLVWAGDASKGYWLTARWNARRSIPLELLRPLLDADCEFYSLQMGEPAAELTAFAGRRPIIDAMGYIRDFYDTACVIAHLDLVISVDTSTAHVAAAMGKPVWLLSRLDGDWRWLHDRSDSPWYPTMKIYRQTAFCDWRPIIARVAADLRSFDGHS